MIECRKLPATRRCEPEKIDIGHMIVREERIGGKNIPEADIIRPELMPGFGAHLAKKTHELWRVPRAIGIIGVAGNPYEAVFCQRTRSPAGSSSNSKPAMRRLMVDVHGIAQRQKCIDVQQEGCHGSSSRNWFTSSGVTIPAPG